MSASDIAAANFARHLQQNSYPGRGLVVGRSVAHGQRAAEQRRGGGLALSQIDEESLVLAPRGREPAVHCSCRDVPSFARGSAA